MHAAARPYVNGGIALVGASVIAISPIAPPLPDIHLPNTAQVAAEAELAAFVNPIATLVDVIQASVDNLATTGGQVFADPVPVLRQIIANQLGVANTLGTAAQGVINAIATSTFPTSLQTALGQLAAGDVTGAVSTFNDALTSAGLGLISPLLPVLSIPSVIAQNMLNVANTVPGIALDLGLSVLSNVQGVTTQIGDDTQSFIDAVGAGDAVTALSTALHAPIDITGAFLNGIGQNVGIFSPTLGLVNVLTAAIPQLIAKALAQGAPTTTLESALKADLKSASALPSVAPKTVTLAVPAQVKARAAKASAPLNAGKTTISNSAAATTSAGPAQTTGSGAGSAKTNAGAVGAKDTKAGQGSAKPHSDNVGKHAAKSGSHK
jgi:hypothetical protein